MAELNTDCCTAETQASCCEPDEKADCCGDGPGCACAAGTESQAQDIRETVRQRYAAAATAADRTAAAGCACRPSVGVTDERGSEVLGSTLYEDEAIDSGTEAAIGAAIGCGVPTAVADLHAARPCSTLVPAPAPTS